MSVRIATRSSPLALWQSNHVKALLEKAHPGLQVELLPLTTQGDRWLETSLAKVGGKGLFVKELEDALLSKRADLAVHSMKDVPTRQPDGLSLAAFLAAADPRDALVSNRYRSLAALPPGACVGTASLRRRSQLAAVRPDLKIEDLRGNVGTRLKKLDDGNFDAILLACAGLQRLGLECRIALALEAETFVPAVGQGIVGIECRTDDATTLMYLRTLDDARSRVRLRAERAFNARLGGACHVPVAGHATLVGERLQLNGLVAAPDGTALVRARLDGLQANAETLGVTLAEQLLAAGGRRILTSLGVAV